MGISNPAEGDLHGLIQPLLAILTQAQVDYTRFWRSFSNTSLTNLPGLMNVILSENTYETSCAKKEDKEEEEMNEKGKRVLDSTSIISLWEHWCEAYTLRVSQEDGEDQRTQIMLQANPKYILRNWVAQEIIEATEAGDGGKAVREALEVLGTNKAFSDESFGLDRWAGPVPEVRKGR